MANLLCLCDVWKGRLNVNSKFGLNTGECGTEEIPYLDNFQVVKAMLTSSIKFVTATVLKQSFSVPPGRKKIEFLHILKSFWEMSQGLPNNIIKLHGYIFERPQDVNFKIIL